MAGGDAQHSAVDLVGHRMTVELDDGNNLDTGVELRLHGGKLRLRIVAEGAMHIHRQLAVCCLLPRPIREESRLDPSGSPVEDRNYLLRRVGITAATVTGDTAHLKLAGVEIESTAFAGSFGWRERRKRVKRVQSRSDDLPAEMSAPLNLLWKKIEAGKPLTSSTESHIAQIMAGARGHRPAYQGNGDVLPVLEGLLGLGDSIPVSEVEEIIQRTATVAGRKRSGQGFTGSAEYRRAVEIHAMNVAIAHYSQTWDTIEDVSAVESFDLRCTSGNAELRVEVKGTSTVGETVLLTPNEVSHARSNHPNTALFVVANIEVRRDPASGIEASGGTAEAIEPWRPDEDRLKPTGFQYEVPKS